jgi:hypothetical protein
METRFLVVGLKKNKMVERDKRSGLPTRN